MKVREHNARKWVSLMLPEERTLSNTTYITEEERPVIEDDKLIEFDRKLKRAIMGGLDVEITYYVDQSFQTIQSQIKRIDTNQGCLYLVHGNQSKMPLTHIISVELKGKNKKEMTTVYRGIM